MSTKGINNIVFGTRETNHDYKWNENFIVSGTKKIIVRKIILKI